MNECNPLVYLSFKNIIEKDFDWQKNIRLLLNNIGLGYILTSDDLNPEVEVYKRLVDIFQQRVFEEIRKEDSKLRTYSLVKQDFKREPYFENVKNLKDRISLTKFRLSNHNLMIEKGRHLKLPISERKCPFCLSIEDEKHFLLDCHVYVPLRNELITTVENTLHLVNLRNRGNEILFRYLLGNNKIAPADAKYLSSTLDLRDFYC